MFIQTHDTPNPDCLKFIPGVEVISQKPVDFKTVKSAKPSPLAEEIFSVKGVKAVFFGIDFVTITKAANANWDAIKPQVLYIMMEFFASNKPVFAKQSKSTRKAKDEDPIVAKIKDIIETRVRPAVAQDGGDIIFHSFKDGVVKLELHGACSGCPSSTLTLKSGIENMLKHYVPEVLSVEAVNQGAH